MTKANTEPGKRGIPAKMLLSLVTVVLLLFGAEVLCRFLVGPVESRNITPVPRSLIMASRIPQVPYVLRPNAEAVHEFGDDPRGYFDPGATLTYHINSLGFRGEEVPRRKPPGIFRIVGIGDSFTFGTGVRNSDTFLAYLQRRIRTERKDRRYEVLNLGVMGYNTVPEVQYLRYFGVSLDPDLVVICFFLNDTGEVATHAAFNATSVDRKSLPVWRRWSCLLDHLATRSEKARAVQDLVQRYLNGFADTNSHWQQAKQALRLAKAIADRRRFRLVLMIFPILWDLSENYPFLSIHEKVRGHAESLGIPVLDLLPAFAGYQGPELWVHPTNQHPNEKAHAIAGEALYRFLSETHDFLSR